jgi:hypothetical protein
MLLHFALEYVTMKVQGNRKELEPNDPNQVSVNSDDSNLLSEKRPSHNTRNTNTQQGEQEQQVQA